MTDMILFLPIFIPLLAGLLAFIIPKRFRLATEFLALSAVLLNLVVTIVLFKKNLSVTLPWAGWGMECSLRLYHFSAFILLALAGFGCLVTVYSVVFMRTKAFLNQFYAYLLLTLALASGVALADNLALLLFFWEGLLVTLFGMIAIGNPGASKTAIKAFIIVGITDVCLLLGIALAGHLAGTLTISKILLPLHGWGGVAFILLMIGAISKAGAMPFHSWIPDAALDAPLPFMALIPAAFEKLLGIYFLTRISLDMFNLQPASWASSVLMVIGAVTILLAVMMALVQKDYKRLLSYHAISQVGYMILGIGTAVPAGIVGGLFHMINNALYKSGLFLTAGSVERQAGTTSLEKLGGLGVRMPVTFACFIITAVSISGVPPFNGFFSKELVYDAALERGLFFYLAALAGSFFTAASFLKLGHAVFLGKISQECKNTKEAPLSMVLPAVVIACVCIFFGIANYFPLNNFIQPILGVQRLEGRSFAGMPANSMLVIATVAVLIAALLNHLYGFRKKGTGLGAVDHIHHAPVLSGIYKAAEKGSFDPYGIGWSAVGVVSYAAWGFDRLLDWVYDIFAVKLAFAFSRLARSLHTGNYAHYIVWSIAGAVAMLLFLLRSVSM